MLGSDCAGGFADAAFGGGADAGVNFVSSSYLVLTRLSDIWEESTTNSDNPFVDST